MEYHKFQKISCSKTIFRGVWWFQLYPDYQRFTTTDDFEIGQTLFTNIVQSQIFNLKRVVKFCPTYEKKKKNLININKYLQWK